MKRVDMHIHTCHSFDCLNHPVRLIERAKSIGLDMVCITDHNEIDGALRLKQRFPEHVIVGEEVKTGEGVDVIGLFIHTKIPKGTPARQTCDMIHEQGGLVYVPHPYASGKGGSGKILPVIDGMVDIVEGHNGRIHHPELNLRAQQWAAERNLPIGAGSDAHTLAEVGTAFVEMPDFDDSPQSFLAAIRSAKINGRSSSYLVHAASTYAKFHKAIFPGTEWS